MISLRQTTISILLPADSLIYGTSSNNPGTENETEIKMDYTEPFSKNIILGSGGKISFDDINSSSDVLSFQPTVKTYFFDSSLSTMWNIIKKYMLYIPN